MSVLTFRKKRGFGLFFEVFAKWWDWSIQNKKVPQVGQVVREHTCSREYIFQSWLHFQVLRNIIWYYLESKNKNTWYFSIGIWEYALHLVPWRSYNKLVFFKCKLLLSSFYSAWAASSTGSHLESLSLTHPSLTLRSPMWEQLV